MSPSSLPVPSPARLAEPSFLVVDDNPRHRRLIAHALKALGRVREAARGEEVLAMLGEERTDLVCLDLSLPEASGFAVCRQIREAKLPALVLAISERMSVTDRAFAKEVGADDILEKPFRIRELNRRVEYLLKMHSHSPAYQLGASERPRSP